MYKEKIRTILLGSALILIITGCNIWSKQTAEKPGPGSDAQTPAEQTESNKDQSPATIEEKLSGQSKINKFSDIDEAREFLESNAGSASPAYERALFNAAPDDGADDMLWGATKNSPSVTGLGAAGEQSSAVKKEIASPADFSQTNTQVKGVDEADIIKTDGKFIYAVSRNNLFIIESYPPDKANILSKIEFKSRPQEIYINGDHLIVYGQDERIYETELYQRFRRQNSYAFFKVFDISDRKNPKQVRDLGFEGMVSDSRMIGDFVYLVTTNYQYYLTDNEPVLPRVIDGGAVLPEKCAGDTKCFVPDIYYFDIPYPSYNFTSVTAINVKDAAAGINGDIYLMSASQNLYVSQNNLYITYTKYISEYELEIEVMKDMIYPRLSERDKERIAKIEAIENGILTAEEKRNKIMQIIERFGASLSQEEQTKLEAELKEKMKQKYDDISKELEKTVIHKIAISGEMMAYKATGEVTGNVLNQFSMDEKDNYLRIATTKNTTWSRYETTQTQSYNNMYILDENLKLAGTLEKLAAGERIYSVRFMGDRAYMVTFKQTDPLFAIDLSDPKAPKVLGTLKIPGFSNYLHPYDDTTLIGLGKDTSENQWGGVTTRGIKLSLFDVADVTSPKEIDTYILGDSGSDSIALYDHKAFLFSRDKNLLVIPATTNDAAGTNWGRMNFSGAVVLTVDKTGFKLKGKIDHSDGGLSAESDHWRGYTYYDNNVLRSLYINDILYTYSNNYLKMNDLDSLKEVNKLQLKKEKVGDYDIIN